MREAVVFSPSASQGAELMEAGEEGRIPPHGSPENTYRGSILQKQISVPCFYIEKRGKKKSKPICNKANKKNWYFIEKGLRHPLIPISSLSFTVAVKKDLRASKLMLPEGFPPCAAAVFRYREVLDPANIFSCEMVIIQLFL